MKKIKTRYLLAGFTALFVSFLFWYSGVDFMYRSLDNAMLVLVIFVVAVVVFCVPHKFKDEQ